jgi:hypothetical protein
MLEGNEEGATDIAAPHGAKRDEENSVCFEGGCKCKVNQEKKENKLNLNKKKRKPKVAFSEKLAMHTELLKQRFFDGANALEEENIPSDNNSKRVITSPPTKRS